MTASPGPDNHSTAGQTVQAAIPPVATSSGSVSIRHLVEKLGQVLRSLRSRRRRLGNDTDEREPPEAERRRMLERVEREPTFLEAVLHHLPAGVLIVEAPSGRVLFHNGLVTESKGRAVPRDAVAGGRGGYRPIPYDRPLARAVARGEVADGREVGCERGDGMRGIALVRSAAVRAASGKVMAQVAVFQDVTRSRPPRRTIDAWPCMTR